MSGLGRAVGDTATELFPPFDDGDGERHCRSIEEVERRQRPRKAAADDNNGMVRTMVYAHENSFPPAAGDQIGI
jgi:hypothetical protein